jgi:hypothetical protein
LTAIHWNQRNAKLTSLDVALLGQADPVDHHAVAILPTAGASEFPWKVPAKKILVYIYKKTTSFLVSQTAQQSADAAVNNNVLYFLFALLDHLLKRSSMLWGGTIPNSKCTARHKNLTKRQSIKRWWMVSGEWQKQHFVSPFQIRLTRLSLVKITPFFRYHKNIFIFVGTLICQISCDIITPLLINAAAYMDLTEKLPDECNAQTKKITLFI